MLFMVRLWFSLFGPRVNVRWICTLGSSGNKHQRAAETMQHCGLCLKVAASVYAKMLLYCSYIVYMYKGSGRAYSR